MVSSMPLVLAKDGEGRRAACELVNCIPPSAIRASLIMCSCIAVGWSGRRIGSSECSQVKDTSLNAGQGVSRRVNK